MKQALTDFIRMVFGLPPKTEIPTVGIVIFILMMVIFLVVFAALNFGL
jgi:hypothetical protein